LALYIVSALLGWFGAIASLHFIAQTFGLRIIDLFKGVEPKQLQKRRA